MRVGLGLIWANVERAKDQPASLPPSYFGPAKLGKVISNKLWYLGKFTEEKSKRLEWDDWMATGKGRGDRNSITSCSIWANPSTSLPHIPPLPPGSSPPKGPSRVTWPPVAWGGWYLLPWPRVPVPCPLSPVPCPLASGPRTPLTVAARPPRRHHAAPSPPPPPPSAPLTPCPPPGRHGAGAPLHHAALHLLHLHHGSYPAR